MMSDLGLLLNVAFALGLLYTGWYLIVKMPRRLLARLSEGGDASEYAREAMEQERDRLLARQAKKPLTERERAQLAQVQLWIATGGRSGGLDQLTTRPVGPLGTAQNVIRIAGFLCLLFGGYLLVNVIGPLLEA